MTKYRVVWSDEVSGAHGEGTAMSLQSANLTRIIEQEKHPERVYTIDILSSFDINARSG